MIFPTASDVLRCIDQTLLDTSDPEMPRMAVKSALATSRHLIRHVELRLRHESWILRDDVVKTTMLLETVAAYLDAGNDPAMSEMGGRIRATLTTPAALDEEAGGDGMDTLRTRVLALREQVYAVLALLQRLTPERKAREDYREIRRLFRDHIAHELAQEALLVQPAFAGKGPRR